jgi:hypothetical protein
MALTRDADEVRVPTADETAQSVRRARRALQELKHRQAAEARHAEDEGQEEASRRARLAQRPRLERARLAHHDHRSPARISNRRVRHSIERPTTKWRLPQQRRRVLDPLKAEEVGEHDGRNAAGQRQRCVPVVIDDT